MTAPLVDTHAHVSFRDYSAEEILALIARAKEAGLVRIVTIGAGDGIDGNVRARELAAMYPDFVAFTAGVHPHDVAILKDADWGRFEDELGRFRPVAIGEVGLDYYYEHSPREVQKAALERFVALAVVRDLPLVIHDRGAGDECVDLIRASGAGAARGVVHCFTGSLELAKKYLDLGFLLSFTGIVTFKKADEVREVVRFIPADRFMVETDSPYLAPVPYRGKRNEPAYVREVAKAIADIRGVSLSDVAERTTETAMAFFGLA